MDKKEIFTQIEAMEEQMGAMYADLTKLKATVVELLEDNQRLQIENERLLRLIRQETHQELAEEPAVLPSKADASPLTREGYENLARLYHEGFHICNVYYGHLRTEGDCLFCMSFLNK
ncbi:MAG: replication initiation control protein YabA [Paenibacillaceae bacterium]|nr:replication initiation control protein YabA [Paenibacillaceae bacterium]